MLYTACICNVYIGVIMRTFNEYAEKAIERYGLTGYNNLARELNMNKATVSYFRSGKALPSEATMIKLAELAGLPKEEALIDLNLWRSKNNPEVNKIWTRLSKMIGIAVISCIISNAETNSYNIQNNIISLSNAIYYV